MLKSAFERSDKLEKAESEKTELEEKLKTEIERKKQNSLRSFFLTLSVRKRPFEELSSKSNVIPAKRIKLPWKISPLALPNNWLSKQVDDECHENLLSPGMKSS